MNLLQLKYFVNAANSGNISKTAKELFVSQPALDSAIARLEDELGFQLFEQAAGRIRLTAAGKLYKTYVEKALDLLTTGQEIAREASYAEMKKLRIVTSLGIAKNIFQNYSQQNPELATEVVYCGKNDLMKQQLLNGEADFAVILGEGFSGQGVLEHEQLMEGRWSAAVLGTDPRQEKITMEELKREHLFCSSHGETRRLITESFAEAGYSVPLIPLDDREVLLEAVLSGLGMVICIPLLYAMTGIFKNEIGEHKIKFLPIEGIDRSVNVYLVWQKHKYETQEQKKIIQMIREHFQENEQKVAALL